MIFEIFYNFNVINKRPNINKVKISGFEFYSKLVYSYWITLNYLLIRWLISTDATGINCLLVHGVLMELYHVLMYQRVGVGPGICRGAQRTRGVYDRTGPTAFNGTIFCGPYSYSKLCMYSSPSCGNLPFIYSFFPLSESSKFSSQFFFIKFNWRKKNFKIVILFRRLRKQRIQMSV